MPRNDADDLPDFNDDLDPGSSPFPCGTYELDVYSLATDWSKDESIGNGDALMFRAEFKVVEVVHEEPANPAHANDKPRQSYGVKVDEIRRWQGQIGPKDKKGKLSYKCTKTAARVKELMQALLRFEPGGKLAAAVGEKQADGSIKGPWNAFFQLAIGENQPFGSKPVRMIMTRIQGDSGFGMYVPQFLPSSRVKLRETSEIDSF